MLIYNAILIRVYLTILKSQGEIFKIILIGLLVTPSSIPHSRRKKKPFSLLTPPLFADTLWSCKQSIANKEEKSIPTSEPLYVFDN